MREASTPSSTLPSSIITIVIIMIVIIVMIVIISMIFIKIIVIIRTTLMITPFLLLPFPLKETYFFQEHGGDLYGGHSGGECVKLITIIINYNPLWFCSGNCDPPAWLGGGGRGFPPARIRSAGIPNTNQVSSTSWCLFVGIVAVVVVSNITRGRCRNSNLSITDSNHLRSCSVDEMRVEERQEEQNHVQVESRS